VRVVWDDWNTSHIMRHHVSISEIEKALSDDRAIFLLTYNKRILALARSGKRLLAIVLNEEEKGIFYIITARDMSKKERRVYKNE